MDLKQSFVSFTNFFISSGVEEKNESIPVFLFKQMCFSIIVAPSVTAATADIVPIVWSESPISH